SILWRQSAAARLRNSWERRRISRANSISAARVWLRVAASAFCLHRRAKVCLRSFMVLFSRDTATVSRWRSRAAAAVLLWLEFLAEEESSRSARGLPGAFRSSGEGASGLSRLHRLLPPAIGIAD